MLLLRNHRNAFTRCIVHKTPKPETTLSPTHRKTDTARRTTKCHRAKKICTHVTCTKNTLCACMCVKIGIDTWTQQTEAVGRLGTEQGELSQTSNSKCYVRLAPHNSTQTGKSTLWGTRGTVGVSYMEWKSRSG